MLYLLHKLNKLCSSPTTRPRLLLYVNAPSISVWICNSSKVVVRSFPTHGFLPI